MKVIGIGVDIAANIRFKQILEKSTRDRFLSKVLHIKEIEILNQKKVIDVQAQYLASRWATKEALVKATQLKDLIYPNIEVFSDPNGKA